MYKVVVVVVATSLSGAAYMSGKGAGIAIGGTRGTCYH